MNRRSLLGSLAASLAAFFGFRLRLKTEERPANNQENPDDDRITEEWIKSIGGIKVDAYEWGAKCPTNTVVYRYGEWCLVFYAAMYWDSGAEIIKPLKSFYAVLPIGQVTADELKMAVDVIGYSPEMTLEKALMYIRTGPKYRIYSRNKVAALIAHGVVRL